MNDPIVDFIWQRQVEFSETVREEMRVSRPAESSEQRRSVSSLVACFELVRRECLHW